ncbi:hypothetical protein VNO77_42438 [Canavalia gladiata]|uniref:Uncharacterized protein n=1 Tax=Canavalia gladiata TaxID=3824 RepID=A0AAN9JST4_CANGL
MKRTLCYSTPSRRRCPYNYGYGIPKFCSFLTLFLYLPPYPQSLGFHFLRQISSFFSSEHHAAVASFTHMLHMRPPPRVHEFTQANASFFWREEAEKAARYSPLRKPLRNSSKQHILTRTSLLLSPSSLLPQKWEGGEGIYLLQVEVYEVKELGLKFERHLDSEIVDFQVLTEDYSKLACLCADC